MNKLKFKEGPIKEILINGQLNRFETKNRFLVLDGVRFLVVTNENIKSNHKPKGLYIMADDILRYIQQNLFGHEKKETKEVKNA